MSLKDILYTDRLPTTGDVEVFLWYRCGLDCDFCKQDHKDNTGMCINSLEKKEELLIDYFQNTKTERSITTILGGEIFGDFVHDKILDRMHNLFLNVNTEARFAKKHADFDVSTNLIFNKTERIDKFFSDLKLSDVRIKLCVSYDIAGRFTNDKQRELFMKNEKLLEKHISLTSFVLTKDTIVKILRGFDDPYFDYLYSKYPMSFSQYNDNEELFGQPEKTLKNRPNDLEFLNAIKILSDKYPKIQNLQQWEIQANKIVKSFNSCAPSKLVILPDNTNLSCTDNSSCGSGCLAMKLADKRDCLSCEYFGYCQVECFHTALKGTSQCVQKEIYDHLRETLP